MVRILIAGRHRASRNVIRALLQMQDGFEIVGETDSGLDAIAVFQDLAPDVVVVDSDLADMRGTQLSQRLTQHGPANVVIVSSHSTETYAVAAFEAGAKAWTQKQRAMEELASAIREVHSGGTYLGAPVTHETIRAYLGRTEETTDAYAMLSTRERQVLTLIGQGWSDADLAGSLGVTLRTVKRRRARVIRKLGLTTDADLTHYAAEQNIPPPEA
ncbi:MAG: response regulator [Chloroflexota bacterium]